MLLIMIALLEGLLQKSLAQNGLADVGDDTYLHYLWTSLPAVILSLIVMMFASMDFQVRLLAPYHALRQGASFDSSMNLHLLNRLAPTAMVVEFRSRNFAACAATLALLISSFFTITSGSLFQAQSLAVGTQTQLKIDASFISNATGQDSFDFNDKTPQIMSSLVLEANLSYPAFTYENLAFPRLSLPTDSNINDSSVVIQATVPATRSLLTCKLHTSSDIHYTLTQNHTVFSGIRNPLKLNISGEGGSCLNRGRDEMFDSNFVISTDAPTRSGAFFAAAGQSNNVTMTICSDFGYVWGQITLPDTPSKAPIVTVSALICNETLETVSTTTTFLTPGLTISTLDPPEPIESTAQPSSVLLGSKARLYNFDVYTSLVTTKSAPNLLDNFFGVLTTSKDAVPVSYLGDAARAADVVTAIKKQHGIIRAQALTYLYRGNSTDAASSTNIPVAASLRQFKRRVIQDAISTRILEALMVVTLALTAMTWALMPAYYVERPHPGRDAAEEEAGDPFAGGARPTSLNAVIRLLARGDVFETLVLPLRRSGMTGRDGEIAGIPEQIGTAVGGGHKTLFWMGWGPVGEEAEKRGEQGGRFGIWVLSKIIEP
jgi:hypothetical protein